MTRNRIIIVTAGIMLSLFLASMESTVAATSMLGRKAWTETAPENEASLLSAD